jgi:uncharacterized membrane protein
MFYIFHLKSDQLRNSSGLLKRKYFWKNIKMWIILIVLVLIIIGVIIAAIVIKTQDQNNQNKLQGR